MPDVCSAPEIRAVLIRGQPHNEGELNVPASSLRASGNCCTTILCKRSELQRTVFLRSVELVHYYTRANKLGAGRDRGPGNPVLWLVVLPMDSNLR